MDCLKPFGNWMMDCLKPFGNWMLNKWQNYWNLNDNLESLRRELQRLSEKKDDIESEVENAERSGAKERKREVNSWFKEVEETENDVNALTESVQEGGFLENAIHCGERVEKSRARVKGLLEQSQHFGKLCHKAFGNRGERRVTGKLIGKKFDEDLERVLAWLQIDNISNIGIYGMGGVGKTALAKNIHNRLLENLDVKIYWVTVSQEFSIKKLQDDIAICLGLDNWNKKDEDDEDKRAAILSRALVPRSVLILDDVWEEICLEKIGISLGEKKCRLIFTTRSRQVCRGMNCEKELEVKTLGPNESWDLFKTTLHLKTELPADVQEVAKSVTERCAGLPLGIVTVAGSMRGVRDICEWRNALEELKACSVGYVEMEKKVFPILEWSFNRLDECLRHCFLYCSLYPEDRKLEREELIDLFILAELMPKMSSRSKEFDQGHSKLNKLIRACLLEETKNFRGSDCVKMHDLVRDMALRITNGNSKLMLSGDVPKFLVKSIGKENLEITLEQKEWTEDLQAVSFHAPNRSESTVITVPQSWSPNCPKLSTLFLLGFSIQGISDSFFKRMCGLKVLNLNHCKGMIELPNSVSDLVNLTALVLSFCKELQSVPPLGNLKQLRELDLSETEIKDLPEGLESLVNLERLKLERCRSITELPNSVSDLVNLTALILRDCEDLRSVPPLGKLKQLRELDLSQTKIEDFPQGLESLVNLERLDLRHCVSFKMKILPKGTFSRLHRLQRLGLPHNCVVQDPEVLNRLEAFIGGLCFADFYKISSWPHSYDLRVCDNFPCGMGPPKEFDLCDDFKRLCFHKCNLGRGSNYPVLLLPRDVKHLILQECVVGMGIRCLSDVFKNFTSLSNLFYLEVEDSKGIEFLWQFSSPAPHDQLVDSSSSLKELSLVNLPDLVGLFFRESSAYLLPPDTFSSLEAFCIRGCHNMKQLITVQLLQKLQNFEDLHVSNCEGLEEIAGDENGVGQGGGEGIQLTSSEATTIVVLPKLRTLALFGLPQLKNICKATMRCDSIKDVAISVCPNLKRLPFDRLPPPPGILGRIWRDKEWWKSLE